MVLAAAVRLGDVGEHLRERGAQMQAGRLMIPDLYSAEHAVRMPAAPRAAAITPCCQSLAQKPHQRRWHTIELGAISALERAVVTERGER